MKYEAWLLENFMVILIKKWQYNKINIDFSNHVPIVQGWLFGLDQLYMALRMRFECFFFSLLYLSFDISNKQSIILENLYCGCNIFFDVPAVETYLLKTHISWLYILISFCLFFRALISSELNFLSYIRAIEWKPRKWISLRQFVAATNIDDYRNPSFKNQLLYAASIC